MTEEEIEIEVERTVKRSLEFVKRHKYIYGEVFDIFKKNILEKKEEIGPNFYNLAATVLSFLIAEFYGIIMDDKGEDYSKFFVESIFNDINKWEIKKREPEIGIL